MSVDYGNPDALKTWLSARPTRNPVLEVMRDTFDSGDAYGSAVMWHFAICDAMQDRSFYIPGEWEFTPSPFGSDADAYEYQAIDEELDGLDSATEARWLTHAGNVLHRYATQLRLSGQDY